MVADLRQSVELLDNDISELKQMAANKEIRYFDLVRLLKNYHELIPLKDKEIQKVNSNVSKFEKSLDILKNDIAELEEASEPLIIEIQKTKNLIEQVNYCHHTFYY